MRLASFSLLFMAATRAAARAAGAADVSHTTFDLSGPLAQFGYVTPPCTGITSAPMERAKAEKATITLNCAAGP